MSFKPLKRYYAYSASMDEKTPDDPSYNEPLEFSNVNQDKYIKPEDIKPHPKSNLVTSYLGGDSHAPVIDIDVPCALIPSSQPGHYHLYIDKEMSSLRYDRILRAMAQAGVVEQGYYDSFATRGVTAVRIAGKNVKPNVPVDWVDRIKEQGQVSYDKYQLELALYEIANKDLDAELSAHTSEILDRFTHVEGSYTYMDDVSLPQDEQTNKDEELQHIEDQVNKLIVEAEKFWEDLDV